MSSKAYADWTSSLLRPFLRDFRASAIELVQLPTSAASKEHKNTADIQLAVDALEMVFLPVRPDTIVIVGGDRDYVPLVQKLKRYGSFVMGIGVEAGVSRVLTEACDSFVYYDHILPPAPEGVADPISLPDPQEAYSLMVRAIEALTQDGRASPGASVHAMMKQLVPAFNLARYKTTFKDLALDAQRAGHVALTENLGSDFILTAESAPGTRSMPAAEPSNREYDYSTLDTTTSSYRTILQEHRIPLLPWTIREKFVQLLWETLDYRGGEHGISLHEMRGTLEESATTNGLPESRPAIEKLIYTLNFARCFGIQRNSATGYRVQVPLEVNDPLYPAVDVDEAVNRIHKRYIEILAGDDAILDPDAVFAFLYGNEISDESEVEKRKQQVETMCRNVKPMGSFGQALIEASRRKP